MKFNPRFLQLRDFACLEGRHDTSGLCFVTNEEILVPEFSRFFVVAVVVAFVF